MTRERPDEEQELAEVDASLGAPPATGPTEPVAAPPAGGVGRQALVYGIGEVLSKAVSFIMLPLYTSYLTPADYGVVSLVDMTFNLVAIIAGARLTAGIFRFFHKADSVAERNTVISTAFLLIVAAYAIVSTAGFVFAPELSRLLFRHEGHTDVLRLAAASFLLQGALAVPISYLTAAEKPTIFVSANVGKLFLQATLNYVFLAHMHLGIKSVFTSSLIANAISVVGLAWFQINRTGLGFSSPIARRLLRFWWPLVFTQIALFVLTYADRYFLQRAGGDAEVGLYSLAYNFGFLLVQIGFSPFAKVWDSVRFRLAKERGAERDAPFSQAFIDVNILLMVFGTGILLFVRDFLRLMSNPAFHVAADLVPVILVAYLLQCWTMMQEVGVMVTERTGWNTVANVVGAIVALAAYMLLIPRFLGFGAAWATLISFAVRWVILYAASQRLWYIRYRWSPVLRLLALSTAAGGAGFMLPSAMHLVASIAAHSAIFLGYSFALWHLGVIAPPMQARALGVARGVTSRFAR